MKYVKYILGILALLVIGFFLIGLIKPELSYDYEIMVNKPLAESWAVSQDEEKMADWLDGFQKIEHVSGTPGTVGSVSDVYFISDGQEMTIRETIEEIVPRESIAMSFASDFMNMDYKLMMTAIDRKTKISSTTTAMGNGMVSKSIMALMGNSIKAQEETNLANLKKTIENNSKNYFNELFNGKSLEGWEGSNTFFRVEKGAIVGGSLTKPIDQSYYLCTKQDYENFELKLLAKFKASDLKTNGGISFRAKRVTNSNEVMGYQADIGYIDASAIVLFSDFTPKDTTGLYPLWGSLVDENRPNTERYPRPDIFPVIIYEVADKKLIEEVVDPDGWNEVYIKAEGPVLGIKINGVTTAKYTEKDDVPAGGCICLQTHAGEPFEVWYKDIVLNQLGNKP